MNGIRTREFGDTGELQRYRRGTGFKSRAGLNFFQALFSFCSVSVHYCEDHSHIHVSRSPQIVNANDRELPLEMNYSSNA